MGKQGCVSGGMPVGGDVEEFGPAEEEKEGERPDVSLEEGQKPRIRNPLPMPTQAEVDEHMATHIPFRS